MSQAVTFVCFGAAWEEALQAEAELERLLRRVSVDCTSWLAEREQVRLAERTLEARALALGLELLSQSRLARATAQGAPSKVDPLPVRGAAATANVEQYPGQAESTAAEVALAAPNDEAPCEPAAVDILATAEATAPSPVPAEPPQLSTSSNRPPTPAVARLQAHFDNRIAEPRDEARLLLDSWRSKLGSTPASFASLAAMRTELGQLRSFVGNTLGQWTRLPKELHVLLLAWLTCRIRAVQAALEHSHDATSLAAIDSLMRTLSHHSKVEQPGFVHGLAHRHTAKGVSWSADAAGWQRQVDEHCGRLPSASEPDEGGSAQSELDRAIHALTQLLANDPSDEELREHVASLLAEHPRAAAETRLVGLVEPWAECFQGDDPRFSRLRQGLRRRAESVELGSGSDGQAAATTPSSDLVMRTQGLRLLLVGGSERPASKEAIADAFGFASIDWVPYKSVRRGQSAIERIEAGQYDVVVVLTAFIDHPFSKAVFNVAKKHCKVLSIASYSVAQLAQSFARNFAEAQAA